MKIKEFIKKIPPKIYAVTGAFVLFATAVDYFLKWKIYSYLLHSASEVFIFLSKNIFLSTSLFLIIIIVVYVFRTEKTNRRTAMSIRILTAKNKNLSIRLDNLKKDTNRKMSDIKLSILDFEFEQYSKNNQIGAISTLIEKMKLMNQKGSGSEVLPDVEEYIKEHDMPATYMEDLKSVLDKLPEAFKDKEREILKLANEKMYTI